MHWEVVSGTALQRPTAFGQLFGSGFAMANCMGRLLGECPWGGQLHWKRAWEWSEEGLLYLGRCLGSGPAVANFIGKFIGEWPCSGQLPLAKNAPAVAS